MSKNKKRVSGFELNEKDYEIVEKAAQKMGISIPMYFRIKGVTAAKEEHK